MVSKVKIGQRLTELRNKAGKTQQEVADDNGTSVSAIAMYEAGKRIPRDEVKVSLANYFHRSIEEIFFTP
mgnify:FL=1